MGYFYEVIDYLDKRRDKIILGTKMAQNRGAMELKDWDEYDDHKEELLEYTLDLLSYEFNVSSADTLAGMTKLLAVINAIGKFVQRKKGIRIFGTAALIDKCNTVGALVIEAMMDSELVFIDQNDPLYFGPARMKPWMIHMGVNWIYLKNDVVSIISKPTGISETRIEDVKSLYAEGGRPIVKNYRHQSQFDALEGTAFVKKLNALQQAPWRINTLILAAISNHKFKSYPAYVERTVEKYEVNDLMSSIVKEEKKKKPDLEMLKELNATMKAKSAEWENHREYLKERARIFARNRIITKANKLKQVPEFYFHVEADYRGRCYYTASSFSYQGDDLAKGLLESAVSRPMNISGYIWMLRQAACLYGKSYTLDQLRSTDTFSEDYVGILKESGVDNLAVDKMSLADREAWSRSKLSFIKRVARQGKILKGAEKPVMFLAFCIEISKYLECLSEGKTHHSHLLVPIDG